MLTQSLYLFPPTTVQHKHHQVLAELIQIAVVARNKQFSRD